MRYIVLPQQQKIYIYHINVDIIRLVAADLLSIFIHQCYSFLQLSNLIMKKNGFHKIYINVVYT